MDGREPSLVLPGGSTPRAFLARLAQEDLDWERVWITLTDERWVSPHDPRSNERQVRELLFGGGSSPRFVGLVRDVASPEEAVADYSADLQAFPRPFDVVVLGMGEDGHVASLFPGDIGPLPGSASEVDCVVKRPLALEPRLSLTLSALLDTQRIVLMLHGEKKWSVYQGARSGDLALPVSEIVQRGGARLETWWAP